MKKPYLYAFAAIAFWSTTATVSKLLLHSFTTMQILAVCSAVAAVFLLTVNLASGKHTVKNLSAAGLSDHCRRGYAGNIFL